MTVPVKKIESMEADPVIAEDRLLISTESSGHEGPYLTRIYVLLPLSFLSVTLLGGLRLSQGDNAFIFRRPALVCLVFAAMTLVLFARAGAISVEGWFERVSGTAAVAHAALMAGIFAATVQLYNALLPEQGLPFWIMGFCFFWALWTNLFADLDHLRLLKSLASMFALAFVVNYMVLPNLAAPSSGSWVSRIIENPGREAATWLLDLPRYSAGTGYIQFFTVCLYLIGLYLTPRSTKT